MWLCVVCVCLCVRACVRSAPKNKNGVEIRLPWDPKKPRLLKDKVRASHPRPPKIHTRFPKTWCLCVCMGVWSGVFLLWFNKCTIGPCSAAPRFFSGQVSGSSTPFLFLGAEFQFWRILTLPEAVYSHTVSNDIMKWPASTPAPKLNLQMPCKQGLGV